MSEKGIFFNPPTPEQPENNDEEFSVDALEEELYGDIPGRLEKTGPLEEIRADQVVFSNPEVIPGLLATVKDELELHGVHEDDAEKATMHLPETFKYNPQTGGLVLPFATKLDGKPYTYEFRVDRDPNDWQQRQ